MKTQKTFSIITIHFALSTLLTSPDPLSLSHYHAHLEFDYVVTFSHTITPNHYFTAHYCFYIGPLFLGTFQLEPATNWFDESFAPFLKSHERFARQQRSRTSITHNATSSNSRKDHQLSSIKNIILLHR